MGAALRDALVQRQRTATQAHGEALALAALSHVLEGKLRIGPAVSNVHGALYEDSQIDAIALELAQAALKATAPTQPLAPATAAAAAAPKPVTVTVQPAPGTPLSAAPSSPAAAAASPKTPDVADLMAKLERMEREREQERKAQAERDLRIQRQLAALQRRNANDDGDADGAVGAGDQQQMLQTRQAAAAASASANAGRQAAQQHQLADRVEGVASAMAEGYAQHQTEIEELKANQRRLERELEDAKGKKK